MLTLLRSVSKFTTFEGEDDAAKAAEEAAAAAAAKKAAEGGDETFTQEQVNTMMAEERRKMQEKQRKTLGDLDNLKNKASMTAKEKSELEKKIEELNNQYLTAEEKARRAEEEAEKKRADQIQTLTIERDGWAQKHSTLVVQTAIVNAAAAEKAVQHEQILALVGPKTRLVERLDDEGKPTGEYEPKVSFPDKNKKNEDIVLELSVPEAVKRMKELPQYGNLFEGTKIGGLGGSGSQSKGGKVDLAKMAKEDPAAYRELRKKRIAEG